MKVNKFFNTAGPVNKEKHYKLDPLSRWNLEEITDLINQEKYFLMHAPRQSGKTSCMLALQEKLNNEDDYFCLYVNIESARSAKNDIKEVMRQILIQFEIRINNAWIYNKEYEYLQKDLKELKSNNHTELNYFLNELSSILNKPLVLLIDEIDALHGDAIIAVLSQLRSGYDSRGKNFPSSIMLTGVADIKDYKIYNIDKKHITGGSCFNIKSKSLTLGNFSKEEIKELYLEHTKETGQIFENDIIDLAYKYTGGQPWLVNALAYEACFEMKENRDRSIAITADIFKKAKEQLVISRATHLDQLADKLKEERVRNVIQPMILGEYTITNIDDEQYCIDLGIIKQTNKGLVISNGIYKEVLPRELTYPIQQSFLSMFDPDWINNDKSINTEKLMTMFIQFWRENSETWSANIAGYVEAAPHIIFQAFLQRVANGQGFIEREYGLGMKRADLYLKWETPTCEQRIIFELKLRTEKQNTESSLTKLKEEALIQTAEYADICNATEAHLIIFDRRENIKWDDKIYSENSEQNNYKIKIWGM